MMQHCGRMDNHPGHMHRARPRPKAWACICDDQHCTCPAPPAVSSFPTTLVCPGVVVTEGAPRHLPVEVSL
jgi:hypothetical protein